MPRKRTIRNLVEMRSSESGARYLEIDDVTEFLVSDLESCWLCGYAGKLTGEHKFKKSDLKNMAQPNFAGLRWSDGHQMEEVRGPNASLVRFENTLCAECNNIRTQSADRAWDIFSNFVRANWRELFDAPTLDLSTLFAGSGQTPKDLSDYVVKHLGCKIVRGRVHIPPALGSELLDGRPTGQVLIRPYYCHRTAMMLQIMALENPDP